MFRLAASLVLFPLLLQAQTPAPPPAPSQGAGELMIMPNRIVLEGRERSAEVMLRNAGQVPSSYRISLKEMAMGETGELKERPKQEGERCLSDFLFFSPRQVDLAPGETQTVRLQLRKPENLPDGEYRSHLLFQAIPPATPAAPLGDPSERKLSMNVSVVMGISIPVIARHGTLQGKAALTNLRYWQPEGQDLAPLLSFHLERTGNRSIRGDVTATVESGGKLKKGTLLYERKGVAVYPDVPFRDVHIPLRQNSDGSLKGARLKVTFQYTEQKLPMEVAYLDMAP